MSTVIRSLFTYGIEVPSSIIALTAVVIVLALIYFAALPKPIPGIPYNRRSATRLFGDIPELAAYRKRGAAIRLFWPDLAVKLDSPVAQFFLGPFAKPGVIISDYRESRNLMTFRGRELKRGKMNNDGWAGLTPEHFIAMENDDERFRHTRSLVNDLMNISFIQKVSAPTSYRTILNFVRLWQHKATIANGASFQSTRDLGVLMYDIITAAAFDVHESESQITQDLQHLQTHKTITSMAKGDGADFGFPDLEVSGFQKAMILISRSVRDSFIRPSPWLFHLWNNCRPSVRKVVALKNKVLQSYIDHSCLRLLREGSDFVPRCAIDCIVSREVAAAAKADRLPDLKSARLKDLILGYLLGGYDSTQSTLTFLVKHFGNEQEKQTILRRALHKAHAQAFSQREQPTLQDILKVKVPYLDAFIEEVLRLSNPLEFVAKEASCDMNVLGYFIPKGTLLILTFSGATFHRPGLPVDEEKRSPSCERQNIHAGDWGQSEFPAHEFHPERWLRESDEESGSMEFDRGAGPFMSFTATLKVQCTNKKRLERYGLLDDTDFVSGKLK
ncbi:hypothetical protein BFJ72_g11316 [Fusarium proliferatum]|uniref:Cytochrome P450 n=1 Tax=Gibberella intermedia TaxID=948311 RepID=A0A420SND8_GIBIN|nr:hypothetical protein BFJ72_g11316 [Fusarium proliferatum]